MERQRPDADAVIGLLKERNPGNGHPRLLVRPGGFERIRASIGTDAAMRGFFATVRGKADACLGTGTEEYVIPDGLRLLDTCRRVLEKVKVLAMAHMVTGDARYAERAWSELEAAGSFPDWNPRHFLDTAEMTNAFALAYDWLYHYWSPERRAFLKGAIHRHGLGAALPLYRAKSQWTVLANNWNTVCNAGICMGALALGDEDDVSGICGEILAGAVESLPLSIAELAPDGGYPEGPMYLGYFMKYAAYVLGAMDTALGTDFGLSGIEGLERAGYMPMYLTGPGKRVFNYADGDEGATGGPWLHWLAARFGKPEFAGYHKSLGKGGVVDDLLWYDTDATLTPKEAGLPLDALFRGAQPVASFRSSWDGDALFAAIKGGDNQANHGDLDIGTFVLDWAGKRWALDLGSENYNLPDFWDRRKGRWVYYRKRAEGHNTLVVNPGSGPDQDPFAKGLITDFAGSDREALATIDMTEACSPDAVSASRTLNMEDDRTSVRVTDTVRFRRPSRLYWFMHTRADVAIDGSGRQAVLTMDGLRMTATLASPYGARFTVMGAEPLPQCPNPPGNTRNDGVVKLMIVIYDVTETVLSVVFTPDYGRKP